MTIYLDNIIYSLQTAGGISAYWFELSKRWLQTTEKVFFVEKTTTHNIFRRQLSIPNAFLKPSRQLPLILDRYLPAQFESVEQGIFHSSYYRITNNKNAKSIVTVHDFTYEKMRGGIRREIHRVQKKAALDNAHGIICISENTKKDLLQFYPHLSRKKITVIYNGVSDLFFPMANSQTITNDDIVYKLTDKKYVVFIGSRDEYKNFSFAVRVLEALKDHFLVIVGGKPLSNNEKTFLKNTLGENWQHFMGITTETLNKLYNFAQFLLYPSSYEGFGIPVIEAERAGCPVIALNASSIPEIIGNKDLLLNKTDVQECVEKVCWLDKNRSSAIANGIENSALYSWDDCFSEVRNFYKEILNG